MLIFSTTTILRLSHLEDFLFHSYFSIHFQFCSPQSLASTAVIFPSVSAISGVGVNTSFLFLYLYDGDDESIVSAASIITLLYDASKIKNPVIFKTLFIPEFYQIRTIIAPRSVPPHLQLHQLKYPLNASFP